MTTDERREQIRADLAALKAIEGEAIRANRARRDERIFWTETLLDVAEVAMPATLVGRILLRLVRRFANR